MIFLLVRAHGISAVCIKVRRRGGNASIYRRLLGRRRQTGYRVNRNLDFQLNVYNLFDTITSPQSIRAATVITRASQELLAHSQYAFLIQMWGAGPTFGELV